MPMYDYVCTKCHKPAEVFLKMADISREQYCPCGYAMRRVPSRVHTDLKEFAQPIEMFSIALNHDDEIREFKRNAPNVDIETDPNHPDYGIPIARSRKQKLEALKAVGYQEAN